MNIDNFPSINYFITNPKGHRLEKHIRNNFPEFYKVLYDNYPENLTWTERLYWYFYNLKDFPKCIECGKDVKFKGFDYGYFQYCCHDCSNHSLTKAGKTKSTIIDRYGVDNISKLDFIKRKKENTLENHYGIKYLFQSTDYQRYVKSKVKEKYGVEYASQSKEIKEKIRATNLERYGGNGMESPVLKEKIKTTNLERYGVENPYQIPVVVEKRKKKCIEKYGVENPFNSNKFKEWLKQYNIVHYGQEYVIGSKEIKEKIKNTMLDKYGVENPSNIEGIRDKAKQTTKERYGKEYYTQTEEYHELMNSIIDEVNKKRYNTHKKNGTFNTSKIERDFAHWLDDNGINYIKEYKSEKYPFRCDFYFPDKNVYLEIQGHQTHGKHPFDPNNEDDLKLLKKLQEKDRYNMIKVWTIRDPLKRQWAKEHNLNWHEVFTIKLTDLIEWYNSLT